MIQSSGDYDCHDLYIIGAVCLFVCHDLWLLFKMSFENFLTSKYCGKIILAGGKNILAGEKLILAGGRIILADGKLILKVGK